MTGYKYHYKEYLLWKCYNELARHRQSEWEDPFRLPREELTRHGFFFWIDKIECFFEEDEIALPFFHWNIANESSRFFFVQKNGGTQQWSKLCLLND